MREFFRHIPPNLGLAYVVIIHLSPEHPSVLSEILANCTSMPVAQVEDGPQLKPNHVYVIPPDRELVIDGDDITARPFSEPRGRRAPIDMFFRSVAKARGDGMAVVLSGAGSDGAVGARKIREGGGVVFVQDPADAEYAMMPRSALATGAADVVAPIPRLVEQLVQIAESKAAIRVTADEEKKREIDRVLAFLRRRTGHDFSGYKRATVARRVSRRMQVARKASIAEYADYLISNPEEAQELFGDLLISVTTFFRDPEAYAVLAREVIAPLFENPPAEGIRAWVAGCATGEEAYSLAILMLEEAQRRQVNVPVQIFATDLDEGALATAREGRYAASIAADVSEERLKRFFVGEGEHYRIKKEVRDMVLFATHSVLKDPPFMRLDLVSCRNLLIYLERNIQRQVCALFQYGLKPNGFLFLGSAETVDAAGELFFPVSREARLYRARPRPFRVPPMLTSVLPDKQRKIPDRPRPIETSDRDSGLGKHHAAALEQSAPPSALIGSDHRVLHLSPSAGRYLLPSAGPFTADIGLLVRPEIRPDLRSALRRAFDRGEPTLTLPAMVPFDGAKRRISLQVTPVLETEGAPASQALVFFLDGGPSEPQEAPGEGQDGGDVALRLRDELRHSEERLHAALSEHESALQDLRIANEELQSINEEYRSTSEELETSKEELQSMNEELQTVNAELKSKLENISSAHSDLQNLIASTEIGTLFLDPELRIRMFTPTVADLFNITQADAGRPITDFTHRLAYDDLAKDARTVLQQLAPSEREIATQDGRWLMMRVRPYRTVDDRIDGIVVTFVDVTALRQATLSLQDSEARLSALVHATSDVVYRMGPDWREMRQLSGRNVNTTGKAPSSNWLSRFVHPEDRERVSDAIAAAIESKGVFELEHRFCRDDGSTGWAISRAVPLFDDRGEIREWFGAATDVSRRHEDQQRLQEARDLLSMATEASHLGWGTWDFRTNTTTWDQRGREIVGLEPDETGLDAWLSRVHPDDRQTVANHVAECLAMGKPFEINCRVVHRDGSVRHVHGTGVFQTGGDGRPLRGTGLFRDITDQRGWEDSQRLLVGELNHRVKNTLAIVQSVAQQTRRSTETLDGFMTAFERRLGALASAHGVLTQANWTGASLSSLVSQAVATFEADGDRTVSYSGPAIELAPQAAISFSMALHELGTNAIKYGSLSTPGGHVSVTWRIEIAEAHERLNLEWRESGGPKVSGPTRRGFGTRMLQAVTRDLDGDFTLDFNEDGLVCTMNFLIGSMVRRGDNGSGDGRFLPALRTGSA